MNEGRHSDGTALLFDVKRKKRDRVEPVVVHSVAPPGLNVGGGIADVWGGKHFSRHFHDIILDFVPVINIKLFVTFRVFIYKISFGMSTV